MYLKLIISRKHCNEINDIRPNAPNRRIQDHQMTLVIHLTLEGFITFTPNAYMEESITNFISQANVLVVNVLRFHPNNFSITSHDHSVTVTSKSIDRVNLKRVSPISNSICWQNCNSAILFLKKRTTLVPITKLKKNKLIDTVAFNGMMNMLNV